MKKFMFVLLFVFSAVVAAQTDNKASLEVLVDFKDPGYGATITTVMEVPYVVSGSRLGDVIVAILCVYKQGKPTCQGTWHCPNCCGHRSAARFYPPDGFKKGEVVFIVVDPEHRVSMASDQWGFTHPILWADGKQLPIDRAVAVDALLPVLGGRFRFEEGRILWVQWPGCLATPTWGGGFSSIDCEEVRSWWKNTGNVVLFEREPDGVVAITTAGGSESFLRSATSGEIRTPYVLRGGLKVNQEEARRLLALVDGLDSLFDRYAGSFLVGKNVTVEELMADPQFVALQPELEWFAEKKADDFFIKD